MDWISQQKRHRRPCLCHPVNNNESENKSKEMRRPIRSEGVVFPLVLLLPSRNSSHSFNTGSSFSRLFSMSCFPWVAKLCRTHRKVSTTSIFKKKYRCKKIFKPKFFISSFPRAYRTNLIICLNLFDFFIH